jgi:DNA-binding response OmpR family regulator
MGERKPIILYVDDDQDCLDGIRVVLEAAGYEMVEARSAEEGRQVFENRRPDLVIVDLMMEEVDSGTAFVKELRLLGSEVPIYMLSSVGDNLSMTTDYASLGLAGVFQKPVHTGTLLTVLKARLPRE